MKRNHSAWEARIPRLRAIVFRFPAPVSAAEARRQIRRYLDVGRLPNGAVIIPAPKDIRRRGGTLK